MHGTTDLSFPYTANKRRAVERSVSCVTTECAFVIKDLVSISTLGFTLVLTLDDAPVGYPSGSTFDVGKSKTPDVQARDVRFRLEPAPSKTGGTNRGDRYEVVVSVDYARW